MTTLSKDEIVKMAREAGLWVTGFPTEHIEHFATLCRAPLIAENAALKQAHEINADTLNAMQVEIDDWKARALKAEQVGEPVLWQYRWTNPSGDPYQESQTDWKQVEPTWNQTVQQKCDDLLAYRFGGKPTYEVRGLYATPPSAVPVVEQLVEASTMLLSYTLACEGLLNAKPAGQIDIAQESIAAGQKCIKENGK